MTRTRLVGGSIGILASGGLSVLGAMLVTSGRVPAVRTEWALALMAFVQIQAVGLTCARLGVDGLVLARIRELGAAPLDLRRHRWTRSLPVAVVTGGLGWWNWGTWGGLALIASVLMDVESSVLYAKAAGLGRFGNITIASLANYPLFYALTLSAWLAGTMGPEVGYTSFVISSAIRLTWLKLTEFTSPGASTWRVSAEWRLAAQQPVNFWLFRSDQLLLGIVNARISSTELLGYFFLCRLTEVVAAVSVALGPVFHPAAWDALLDPAKRRPWLPWVALVALGLLAAPTAYIFLSEPELRPKLGLLIPFGICCNLVLASNFSTYIFMRQGRVGALLWTSLVATAPGAVVATFAFLRSELGLLAWVVPVQLASFAALSARARVIKA